MARILIGLITASVIAAGGFFGFEFYTRHRIASEIDAAFDQIRAAGGKASHGKVSFDLWSRTVDVADIATESAKQPSVTVKIANLTVSGASQPAPGRFSADNIEAADVELGASTASPTNWQLSYKAPKVVIRNYSGPANLPQPPASTSAIEMYRFILERFATVSASSVEAPSLAGTFNAATATAVNYSDFALRDIKDGKIATLQIERVHFTANMQQAGKSDKLTGDIANVVSHDFDATAAAAMFDPQKADDNSYHRIYGPVTAGPYTVSSDQGVQVRIDGVTIDDVAVRPSGLQLPALLAMIPAAATSPPTPEQTRAMIEKVAGIYGSIRIGKVEMSGLSIGTPQGPLKLAAIRFNLQDGKIGEFAMEGLDGRGPKGPVEIGRFALKSLDIANLLRVSARFANPAQKPTPDQLLGLLPLLQGVEVKGVVTPFMDTGKTVKLDNFSLNWGEFVGPIPSRARLTLKMTTPVDANKPSMAALVAAGIDTISTDDDLGAAWTEASGAFVLDPVKIQIGGIMEASARISLGHVQRQVFSLNPQQATAMAAQIEAGTIEITAHDIGGVDLAVRQYARNQNVSADAARQAIVEDIRTKSTGATEANPDAAIIVDALVGFIEKPGGTLTLKLTPRGKVPAMLLIQQAKDDPLGALAQFQVEASTRQ
ncbi:MAG: hypothetical protein KGQ48_04815 [Bradyrhizobium sp.]|nr:hypothetical protein [Bradyrhizobium sp.]